MRFTDEQYQAFLKDGYIVVENVLSKELVEGIKQRVSQLALRESECGEGHFYSQTGKMQRVWNLLGKGDVFHGVITQDLILDAMEKIFARETTHKKYYLSSFQANILFPGAEAQKWHLDTPIPEPHTSWIVKANTIWPLIDFTEENGATEVLPGSHTFSRRPKESDLPMLREKSIKVMAKAGSVVITHGHLWHRSGSNLSQDTRAVLLGSFAASFAREIALEDNFFRSNSSEIVASWPEKTREVIGWDHGLKVGASFEH
ncbi:phytanoyl-CoA dioxygenase family protein [Chromobacterium amazonense]|uniref:Phytanoyl-CoA dioxygenase family protein n=1 Tax=Chromobacterium amazonense TaxID=1382803 RepID=A0ABU8V5U5_9NEIS|nr:phytanoyl-CoA dioxygenase family protein [Chromobacterium amazonense]MDQ4538985.1 phytanoyl-CoA dioxygenase family protein [Chromobacterium amazonense]